MNQNYTCSIENHNNNDILGFCLNQDCLKPAQFCFQCFQEIHNSHQDDCVEFDSMEIQLLKQEEKILKFKGGIMKTIDKSLSNTRNLEKEYQKQMETIKRWSTQIKEKQFNELSKEIKEIKDILKNDTDQELKLYEVLNGKFQQYKNKINFNDNRKKAEELQNLSSKILYQKSVNGLKQYLSQINYQVLTQKMMRFFFQNLLHQKYRIKMEQNTDSERY